MEVDGPQIGLQLYDTIQLLYKLMEHDYWNFVFPFTGQNMLAVGIAGPKTPCDEITIKHQGRNRYVVNYTLKERGNYVLMVKWGEQHIAGSPFLINCT